jgi:hypothetical protein
MDGIPAEVTQEVCVFFKDADLYARASQQVAQHYPGWPSTGDAARCCFRHALTKRAC